MALVGSFVRCSREGGFAPALLKRHFWKQGKYFFTKYNFFFFEMHKRKAMRLKSDAERSTVATAKMRFFFLFSRL